MKYAILSVLLSALVVTPALAHHGVASLGAAGLEGPGAPVETTVSATLPEKSWLAYLKLDYADFEKKTPERDGEGNFNTFWMYGLGYGVKSWLSAYIFLPYYNKVVEDNSYNTSGFADMALMGVLGFKYDEGFQLIPKGESLGDYEDWHFTTFGGLTLPTGNANERHASGAIDPGMSLGFGKPSYNVGVSATKMMGRHTLNFDTSYIWFTEYEYADQNKTKFGAETRANFAYVNRLYVNGEKKRRIDGILEANFLSLGRDRTNGVNEIATGGDMLYVTPGIRYYVKNISAAVGLKLPAWTDLNEDHLQQGAEGKENYRLLFTFSTLF